MPGILHPLGHPRLGDLVEGDPVVIPHVHLKNLGQVPGNRLSLAVGVGGENDAVALSRHGFQLPDQGGLAGNIHIPGLEAVIHIHPQQGLGQIADMPHRSNHFKAGAQILFDGLSLGWGLHDDQL